MFSKVITVLTCGRMDGRRGILPVLGFQEGIFMVFRQTKGVCGWRDMMKFLREMNWNWKI